MQAINVISWISIGAIAVSTAAMIILFSVFNGLEDTVKSLFSSFYPDIKVEKIKGKFFKLTDLQKQEISGLKNVHFFSYSLEDMVLLANEEEQRPAVLKGIEEQWFQVSQLEKYMLEGSAAWENNLPYPPVIVGLNIAAALRLSPRDAFGSLNIYYPRKQANFAQNPESALKKILAKPEGIFHIQEDFDNQYLLTPLSVAQDLLERSGQYSSIEFKMNPNFSEKETQLNLERILGPDFKILSRFQQNKTLYMIMQSEKWAVYSILLLVLVIASFNMIGSLSMLVLEKKKDILILKSMGALPSTIRFVFLFEGVIIAFFGGFIGILFGTLVCLGQRYFGWIGLPDGFIMSAYPVSFQFSDYLLVSCTAIMVGFIAALYPAWKASRQAIYLREE